MALTPLNVAADFEACNKAHLKNRPTHAHVRSSSGDQQAYFESDIQVEHNDNKRSVCSKKQLELC